jgi:hypothetical protein
MPAGDRSKNTVEGFAVGLSHFPADQLAERETGSTLDVSNYSEAGTKIRIGDHMKKRALLFSVCALFVAVAVCYAYGEAFIGTWKLNEAKSTLAPGSPKNTMVVYAASGDTITATIDGKDANGKPTHIVWTGKYDGKDYPVTGDSAADMRSYDLQNGHTLSITSKKDGKVVNTILVVLSDYGKTRTVTTNSTDASGVKTTSIAVYDKQ